MDGRVGILLVALALGCSGGKPSTRPDAEAMVRIEGAGDLARGRGKTVRLVGRAVNARLAAMVDGEGFTVYFIPYSEWPDDLVGQPVEVVGLLERTDDYEAQVGPDGARTAGTGGGDWVIRTGQARAVSP
jgi:hypothetical protein